MFLNVYLDVMLLNMENDVDQMNNQTEAAKLGNFDEFSIQIYAKSWNDIDR